MNTEKKLKFGPYILEKKIAKGGMAELFLARIDGPIAFSKKIVLKRILPKLRNKKNYKEMFLDEARLSAYFKHPNLISLHELINIEDQDCLIMEYIDGYDLSIILKQSKKLNILIPINIASFITSELAMGLNYAHVLCDENNIPLEIVHCDLSPPNIFITKNGIVKLLDFGIAQHRLREIKDTNTIKGKLSYLSPEQILCKKIDLRTDLFALGSVFYELLTGQTCFTAPNFSDFMTIITKSKYLSPKELRPDLPANILKTIKKFLDPNIDKRFQTGLEIHKTLENISQENNNEIFAEDLRDFITKLFNNKQPKPNIQTHKEHTTLVNNQFSAKQNYKISTRNKFSQKRKKKIIKISIPIILFILGITLYFYQKNINYKLEQNIFYKKIKFAFSQEVSVHIHSNPPKAELLLDNIKIDTTPLILKNLNLGQSYKILLKHKGYYPLTQVFTPKIDNENLRFILIEKTESSYHLKTLPKNVTIYINGIPIKNKTPTTLNLKANIEYKIVLHLKNYQKKTIFLTLKKNEKKSDYFLLKPIEE